MSFNGPNLSRRRCLHSAFQRTYGNTFVDTGSMVGLYRQDTSTFMKSKKVHKMVEEEARRVGQEPCEVFTRVEKDRNRVVLHAVLHGRYRYMTTKVLAARIVSSIHHIAAEDMLYVVNAGVTAAAHDQPLLLPDGSSVESEDEGIPAEDEGMPDVDMNYDPVASSVANVMAGMGEPDMVLDDSVSVRHPQQVDVPRTVIGPQAMVPAGGGSSVASFPVIPASMPPATAKHVADACVSINQANQDAAVKIVQEHRMLAQGLMDWVKSPDPEQFSRIMDVVQHTMRRQ